ncbi:hypothetical protein Pint_28024 [Pistacia integerrima]|uniref:Uncharacterized protein n=1 Tax=Pistacia integerrima TaxID=434235 RepID=A0ACC0YVH3_9ROSI|nr:hypothetical protein Pint_28024 [Pistacia integerrima]
MIYCPAGGGEVQILFYHLHWHTKNEKKRKRKTWKL